MLSKIFISSLVSASFVAGNPKSKEDYVNAVNAKIAEIRSKSMLSPSLPLKGVHAMGGSDISLRGLKPGPSRSDDFLELSFFGDDSTCTSIPIFRQGTMIDTCFDLYKPSTTRPNLRYLPCKQLRKRREERG